MAEKEPRIYVGQGKKVGQYDLINFSLCLSAIPPSAPFEYKGKTFVKLVIGGKKDGADQWGKTHSVWIDTFKPQKKVTGEENAQPMRKEEEQKGEDINPDDIPF